MHGPSPIPPKCSIFTYELSRLLNQRGHSIDDLRRKPYSFSPPKVDILLDSLNTLRRLPALNPSEFLTVAIEAHLKKDEQLILYAALIALGSQRLLAEYLSPDRAWIISSELRDAAYTWLIQNQGEDAYTRRPSRGVLGQLQSDPLESALEAYDEGTMSALLGILNTQGHDTLAISHSILCFKRAISLFELLPPQIQQTNPWRFWYDEAKQSLNTTLQELNIE